MAMRPSQIRRIEARCQSQGCPPTEKHDRWGSRSRLFSEDSIQRRMREPPSLFFALSAGRRIFRSASSENGF